MVYISGSKGQIGRNLTGYEDKGNLTFSQELGGDCRMVGWDLGVCWCYKDKPRDRERVVWSLYCSCVSLPVECRVTLNASLQFSDLVWSCENFARLPPMLSWQYSSTASPWKFSPPALPSTPLRHLNTWCNPGLRPSSGSVQSRRPCQARPC